MGRDIGDAVGRPMKKALDDLPIHVRQLAEPTADMPNR